MEVCRHALESDRTYNLCASVPSSWPCTRKGLFSMSELCQRAAVFRAEPATAEPATNRLARFEQGGLDGLKDQSRRPHSSPRQTCPEVQRGSTSPVAQVRQDHPTWGPKKLLAYLQLRRPESPRSTVARCRQRTVGVLLKQHGLTQPRKRPARTWRHDLATRRRTALASRHSQPHSEPNLVRRLQSRLQRAVPHPRWQGLLWQGLLPANRERRAHSRFVLCCHALCPLSHRKVPSPCSSASFKSSACPLPSARTRTDNGVPFSTQAICGLLWPVEVVGVVDGVVDQVGHCPPARIEPGSPSKTADTRE